MVAYRREVTIRARCRLAGARARRLRLVGPGVVVGVLLASACVANAATIADPATRVFTIAGGGTQPPEDGDLAGDAALEIARIASFPDDGVLMFESEAGGRLWQLLPSGVLRRIPVPPGPKIEAVDVDPTGAVVVVRDNGSRVERLDPPDFSPTRIATLQRSHTTAADVLALDDGTIVVATGSKTWRIAPGAEPREIARRFRGVDALAPLPDGAIAVYDGSRLDIWKVAADDAVSRIAAAPTGYPLRLESLEDGTLIVAGGGPLFIRAPGGRWRRIGRARAPYQLGPAYGDGDGLARRALRIDAYDVATRRDGSIVVADAGDDYLFPQFDRARVRTLVPPGPALPLVAAAQGTFTSLGAGTVGYTSTVAGILHVDVFRGSEVVARGDGLAEGGSGTIALDRRPPPADLRVRLELRVSGASVAATVGVSAVRRLSFARVRRVLAPFLAEREEGDGYSTYWETLGRCLRRSPLRFDCRVLNHRRIVGRPRSTWCSKRAVVRQRPDGLSIDERRGCRVGPAR